MMYGWGWFLMIPITLLWLVVLGAVFYAAVRLPDRDSKPTPRPRH